MLNFSQHQTSATISDASEDDLERVEQRLGGADLLARFQNKPSYWSLRIILASDWIDIAQYLAVTGPGYYDFIDLSWQGFVNQTQSRSDVKRGILTTETKIGHKEGCCDDIWTNCYLCSAESASLDAQCLQSQDCWNSLQLSLKFCSNVPTIKCEAQSTVPFPCSFK